MRWRSGFDVDFLLQEVRENRRLSDDGKVSFIAFDHESLKSILATALDLGDASTWSLKEHLISRVLSSPDLPPDFTEEQFREVYWKVKNKIERRVVNFKAFFELSNASLLSGKVFRTKGAVVKFSPSERSSFFLKAFDERRDLKGKYSHLIDGRTINNPTNTTVAITGAFAEDAMERAQHSLKSILGLSNYLLNSGKSMRLFSEPKPLSEQIIYPFMTVHEASGALATKKVWYNDHWKAPQDVSHKNNERLEWYLANMESGWRKVNSLPWRDDALGVLVDYFDAFSMPDLESSFLEGWRLMEKVAGRKDESYENLIRRCCFFYGKGWGMENIGQHLKERRNSISHGRRFLLEDNDTLAHQMNTMLREIMRHFLFNPFGFNSLPELWAFCDQKPTKDFVLEREKELEQQHRQVELLRRFLRI